jgi:hypothetical protein
MEVVGSTREVAGRPGELTYRIVAAKSHLRTYLISRLTSCLNQVIAEGSGAILAEANRALANIALRDDQGRNFPVIRKYGKSLRR